MQIYRTHSANQTTVLASFADQPWASLVLRSGRHLLDVKDGFRFRRAGVTVGLSRATVATSSSKSQRRQADLPADVNTNTSTSARLVHWVLIRQSWPASSW
jgi:hypothetical protein